MNNALRLTASLIENRDALRRILGPSAYDDQIRTARAVLLGYARKHQLELAPAALEIGRKMDAAGVDPSLIFAAFVDECEAGA